VLQNLRKITPLSGNKSVIREFCFAFSYFMRLSDKTLVEVDCFYCIMYVVFPVHISEKFQAA